MRTKNLLRKSLASKRLARTMRKAIGQKISKNISQKITKQLSSLQQVQQESGHAESFVNDLIQKIGRGVLERAESIRAQIAKTPISPTWIKELRLAPLAIGSEAESSPSTASDSDSAAASASASTGVSGIQEELGLDDAMAAEGAATSGATLSKAAIDMQPETYVVAEGLLSTVVSGNANGIGDGNGSDVMVSLTTIEKLDEPKANRKSNRQSNGKSRGAAQPRKKSHANLALAAKNKKKKAVGAQAAKTEKAAVGTTAAALKSKSSSNSKTKSSLNSSSALTSTSSSPAKPKAKSVRRRTKKGSRVGSVAMRAGAKASSRKGEGKGASHVSRARQTAH